MFDIGFGEMILIAVIALVAIGPKQLPEVARTVGKFIGEFKRMFGDVATGFIDARDSADRELRKFKDDVTGSVFSQPIQKNPSHNGPNHQEPSIDSSGESPFPVGEAAPSAEAAPTSADGAQPPPRSTGHEP